MPQQFNNSPQRQINPEEYRNRLEKLVKAPAENAEVTEPKPLKSWVLERHKQEAGADLDRQSKELETTREQLKHVEAPESKPVQNTEKVQSNGVNVASTKIADKNSSSQEYLISPVKEKNANPKEASYWTDLWQEYINGSVIKGENLEKIILEIRLPVDTEVEVGSAEQMYSSFSKLGDKPNKFVEFIIATLPQLEIAFKNPAHAISLEVVADVTAIRFWVVVPKEWVDYVERQIHAVYPEAEVDYAKADYFLLPQGNLMVRELKLSGEAYYPIRMHDEFDSDPLSAISSTISKLRNDERVIIQYLIQPADDAWRKRGQAFIQNANRPPKEGEKKAYVDPELLQSVQKKISRTGFRLGLRVLVEAADATNAKSLMETVLGSFTQFSQPHLSSFSSRHVKLTADLAKGFMTRSFPKWGNYPILNTSELATLYHFPTKDVKTPRIAWLRSRKAAPPTNMPTEGLYLGKSAFRNDELKVNLQTEDRQRHMYIIGQTGSGKSEFLKFMAYQDIVNGKGLAFIDPHGEAVEDLLQMIPQERAEDVIYFNAADTERPIGLNILEAKSEEAQHRAINSFIGLLYKLYDPNHSGIIGPQLERAVRNVMLTAMTEQGNTLIEVLKLLTNPKFAEKKVALIKDPLVKSFWTEQMAQTSDFHKSETLGYFVSKFDRFVTEKLMRNIIGQSQSAFDFREVMDKQKILLVNLSKGMIGEENSNFLGLLLVPRLLIAAMSRADMAKEERKDFYLYVDEFQNFSTPDFAQILAEARKYRLSLIVANQYIAQIQEDIKNAVFGNVGTTVGFRVGIDDAEYLEKQFEPSFKQQDLINLPIGNAVSRLLISGQPSTPFSFQTDWPMMRDLPKSKEIADIIKQMSRLKYGRDRALIEHEIAMRAEF